jgi:hypothetical protein
MALLPEQSRNAMAANTPAKEVLPPTQFLCRQVRIERVCSIATRRDLKMMEDCEKAWADRPIRSWDDFGCLKFIHKNIKGAGTPATP